MKDGMKAFLKFLPAALVAAALLLLVPECAMAQGAWPNEPAGSTVISDFDFSDRGGGSPSQFVPVFPAGGQIIDDPTAPLSPGKVLYCWWNHGAGTGNCPVPTLIFPEKEEIFVGFWVKPSNPFTGWPNCINKTGNIFTQEAIIWLHLVKCAANGIPQQGPYISDVAISHPALQNAQAGGYGDSPGSRVFPGKDLTRLGEWHQVEIYAKKSTTRTSADGILRYWINGVLQADMTNINLDSGFTQVQFTQSWDQPDMARPNAFDYYYYDHVYVSAPNCPDGCPLTGNTGTSGGGGGAGSTYKPRQVHTKYINLRPGEVAELKHKSKRNFFQIYGVPPVCSLSAGTFGQMSQAWELTKAEMETVKLTCPPEFCGSVSLTVLSLENQNSLSP
jgi:hypothetical protein